MTHQPAPCSNCFLKRGLYSTCFWPKAFRELVLSHVISGGWSWISEAPTGETPTGITNYHPKTCVLECIDSAGLGSYESRGSLFPMEALGPGRLPAKNCRFLYEFWGSCCEQGDRSVRRTLHAGLSVQYGSAEDAHSSYNQLTTPLTPSRCVGGCVACCRPQWRPPQFLDMQCS